MFFFNKKMACSSFVSTFMANTSNSIMKSIVFFFFCLNISIFYLISAAFVLLLNVVLISLTKSSQFWVPSSLFSSLSFLYVYIPTILSLRQAKIAVILSLVSITLLLLRNSLISLHQSLNFVQSLSNHSGFSIIFLSIIACLFLLLVACAGVSDISVSAGSYLFKTFSMICKDPSYSDNIFILFVLLELVLVLFYSFYYMCFIPDR